MRSVAPAPRTWDQGRENSGIIPVRSDSGRGTSPAPRGAPQFGAYATAGSEATVLHRRERSPAGQCQPPLRFRCARWTGSRGPGRSGPPRLGSSCGTGPPRGAANSLGRAPAACLRGRCASLPPLRRTDAPARCHRRPGGGPQDPRVPRTPRARAAARSRAVRIGRHGPRLLGRGVSLELRSSASRRLTSETAPRRAPAEETHPRRCRSRNAIRAPAPLRCLARSPPSAGVFRAPAQSPR
jgi:hypothetical protein